MTGGDSPRRARWPYIALIPFGFGAWAPIYAGATLDLGGDVVEGLRGRVVFLPRGG